MKENQLCKICGKPVSGKSHPDADVYHLRCIMELPELVKYREEHKDEPQPKMKGEK